MSETSEQAADGGTSGAAGAGALPPGWLSRWPWATFLLPLVVFSLVGSLEPKPPDTPPEDVAQEVLREAADGQEAQQPYFPPEPTGLLPSIPYEYYPWVYTTKIVLTIATMLLVSRGYLTFPWRVSPLSVVVGVVGIVLWVALCQLQLEVRVLVPVDRFLGQFWPWSDAESPSIGLMAIIGMGERSAYNPLEQLASTPVWAWVFLGIRITGLALVVPVIEEFFLRGFLMRFVMRPNWWEVPFGQVNRTAVIVGTAIPMLMHTGELLAAFVWFSLITWLMVRTRSIWDCVVAHAVTNLLLGVYVVTTGNWQLM